MTDGYNEPGPAAHPAPQAPLPTSGKSIASLVLGILSLPMCFCYGIFSILLGIPAIVLGIMAKKDVAAGRVGGPSGGMALAGLICGIAGVCLGLLFIILLIIGIVASETQNAGVYSP